MIETTARPESNPDPLTGAPGAHPVGVGLGAVAGGIAAAAAAGTLAAGPIGTVVGAAIGAFVGGLAGKEAAESVNPTDDQLLQRAGDMRVAASGVAGDRTLETPTVEIGSTPSNPIHANNGVSVSGDADPFEVSHTTHLDAEHYLAKDIGSEASGDAVAGAGGVAMAPTREAKSLREGISAGGDDVPIYREPHTPPSLPPLTHGALQSPPRDLVPQPTLTGARSFDPLSDAAHEATEQNTHRAPHPRRELSITMVQAQRSLYKMQ